MSYFDNDFFSYLLIFLCKRDIIINIKIIGGTFVMQNDTKNTVPRKSNGQPAILVQDSRGKLKIDWECPFKDTANCDDPSCSGITNKKCNKWLMSSSR